MCKVSNRVWCTEKFEGFAILVLTPFGAEHFVSKLVQKIWGGGARVKRGNRGAPLRGKKKWFCK